MRIKLLAFLLCLCQPLYAAVTATGTPSTGTPATWTSTDHSHTVPADSELLLCSFTIRGSNAFDAGTLTVIWDIPTANEALTLIDQTLANDNSGDVSVYTYGLVSPTDKTANVNFDSGATTIDASAIVCSDWKGNDTTDLATATNFIVEDVNNTNASDCTLTSGGSSPNILYVAVGANQGTGESVPFSYDGTWTERTEVDGAEQHVAIATDDAPASLAITLTNGNENACHSIELVAAAGGSVVPILQQHYRRRMN